MQTLTIPNPFNINLNPFEWIRDQIHGLFLGTVGLIEKMIINPPRPKAGPWQQYIYGSALGLAGTLAIAVTIVVIVLAMFFQGRIRSLGPALIVVAVIGLAGPLWFRLCAYLVELGDQLAKSAEFYTPVGTPTGVSWLIIPPIDNVLGAITGLSSVTGAGIILVMIFFMYEVLVILVQFFGILAFAFSPLGPRSRKLLNVLVSVGLVTMVFGRATAVFSLELSKIATNNLPGGSTSFGSTFFIISGIWLAIGMQGVLFYVTYQGQQMIMGRVSSKVSGKVETTTKQRKTSTMGSALAAHAATMQPVPVITMGSSTLPPKTSNTRRLIALGAGAVSTKVATAHPLGAVAVIAVKTVTSSNSKPRG